jgi:hypothetical protein
MSPELRKKLSEFRLIPKEVSAEHKEVSNAVQKPAEESAEEPRPNETDGEAV